MNPLAQFSIDLRVMAGEERCSGAGGPGQGKNFDPRALPCPFLPPVEFPLGADTTRSLGTERGTTYYLCCLRYSQSLWREGKPAQAILQLNKAWLAELPDQCPLLRDWPPPYRALAWILRHALPDSFLGNPVRHFQHLATRVSGPRAIPRSWRAWACFHLAEGILPAAGYPRDLEQVARERIVIPTPDETLLALARHGWPDEPAEWQYAARDTAAAAGTGTKSPAP